MAKHDWEAIKPDYEAGVLSIREVARRHNVPESTLRKKARENNWKRALTHKVRERARENILRHDYEQSDDAQRAQDAQNVRTPNAQDDERVIEHGAKQIESLIRVHRKDIKQGRDLVSLMFEELIDETVNRETLREWAEQYIDDNDLQGAVADRIRKAISLPQRAATARDLSQALQRLVALERQAFNVDEDEGDKVGGLAEALQKARKRAQALESDE